MPNPWLNVHKSTAAMNYLFSNMTNTVIFMTLGDLRFRHTTAVPFSRLHIWIRILVVYVIKFHVRGGRNIRRGKPQMSAFSFLRKTLSTETEINITKQRFYFCSTFHSHNHSRIFNNEHNPYSKKSLKRHLVCSWAVLFACFCR